MDWFLTLSTKIGTLGNEIKYSILQKYLKDIIKLSSFVDISLLVLIILLVCLVQLWSGVHYLHVPVQPIFTCNKRNRSIKSSAAAATGAVNSATRASTNASSSPSVFPIFQNPTPPQLTPASEVKYNLHLITHLYIFFFVW